jgi:hypothetical protein
MPRRTLPPRATNEIESMRVMVLAGVPWRQPERDEFGKSAGYADLIYLVTGHYYPICDFIRSKDDYETIGELWSGLREDILIEHIKRKPGTRPWAWWRCEDREQRKVIRIDKKMLSCDEGRVYETEFDYLERLRLLTAKEKNGS